jgi:ribosomal protein S27AE
MDVVGVSIDGGRGEIDRCPACGGVFFDFDDGEPRELARCMPELPRPRGGVAVRADPACPACGEPLVLGAYLGQGPDVLRCGACAGLAARWDEVEALARAVDVEEPVPEGSWLRRLAEALGLLRPRRPTIAGRG